MIRKHKENPESGHRFYGRRQGRPLKPLRQRLMAELLPTLRIPVPAIETGDEIVGEIDPASFFDSPKKAYWLEIGFGGGEHLATMARTNPDIGFIGCEPFINGVASLLSVIQDQNLQNVRIFDDDVRYLLPALQGESFERIFLLYPDPWHKKKHNRRRMVNDDNIASFARLLKNGGEFRFASDISAYVRWTLGHMGRPSAAAAFHWLAEGPADWRTRPADMIETRYEAKARAKGLACVYLRYERKSR